MENNWCIKLNDENRDVVIQYLNEKYNKKLDGSSEYYGEYNDDLTIWRVKPKHCQELTFEEFKTQILGESKFLSELDNDTKECNMKDLIIKNSNKSCSNCGKCNTFIYCDIFNSLIGIDNFDETGEIHGCVLFQPKNKVKVDKDTKNVFDRTLSSIADLLKYKNAKYGNSVLDPLEIFKGKCKAGDRIDDKLSRIKTSKELRKNDVSDLIGYLVLTCVENNWDNFDEFKD